MYVWTPDLGPKLLLQFIGFVRYNSYLYTKFYMSYHTYFVSALADHP